MPPKVTISRKMVEATGSALALPYRWLVTKLLLSLSPMCHVEGFEVIRVDDQNESIVCDRLGDALRLIRQVDAKRFCRIQRDVRRILVVNAGGPEYWPLANGFTLDTSYIMDAPIERIALSIVHEATHARLWKTGVRYHPALRGRIEALCVQSEIAFAALLPRAGELIEEAQGKLADPWWTEQRIFERRVAAMHVDGWPEWLLRSHNAFFRRNWPR